MDAQVHHEPRRGWRGESGGRTQVSVGTVAPVTQGPRGHGICDVHRLGESIPSSSPQFCEKEQVRDQVNVPQANVTFTLVLERKQEASDLCEMSASSASRSGWTLAPFCFGTASVEKLEKPQPPGNRTHECHQP